MAVAPLPKRAGVKASTAAPPVEEPSLGKIRCFVALTLDAASLDVVAAVQASLGAVAGLRLEKEDNLMVTLCALGEVDDASVARPVFAAVAEAAQLPLALGTARIACFGLPSATNVVTLQFDDAAGAIAALATRATETARGLGVALPERAFVPCITIGRARSKNPVDISSFLETPPVSLFSGANVLLFRTHQTKDGTHNIALRSLAPLAEHYAAAAARESSARTRGPATHNKAALARELEQGLDPGDKYDMDEAANRAGKSPKHNADFW